jgi:hypothetical protein
LQIKWRRDWNYLEKRHILTAAKILSLAKKNPRKMKFFKVSDEKTPQ